MVAASPSALCPGKQALQAYCQGAISEAELETLARHLETCPNCARVLSSWEPKSDALEQSLRRAARLQDFESDPLLQQLNERLAGGSAIPFQLPFRLGKYELLELIGGGGMGVVYRALQTSLQRIVAVKVLSPRLSAAPAVVRRFRNEIRLMGGVGLRQPHLVPALDAETADGRAFLVMEFIDGIDLARLVRSVGPLPIAAAGEIGYQTAKGLQSLHELGLVHRDVKPSNLMLADGVVRLLDFGLARFDDERDDASELTAAGQFLGTVDYISPEQIRDPRQADSRADIYSLGCTLFYLLAGQAPFGGLRSREDKCRAHQTEAPPDLRKIRPDVPADLAEVVSQMLEKDPGARGLLPGDVVRRLEVYADGGRLREVSRLTSREPPTKPELKSTVELENSHVQTRPRPSPRQHKPAPHRFLTAVGVLLAGAVVIAAGVAWSSRPAAKRALNPTPAAAVPAGARSIIVPRTALCVPASSNSFFQINEATNKLHLVADDFLMVELGSLERQDLNLEISMEVSRLKSDFGEAGVFLAYRDSADQEQSQYQLLQLQDWFDGTSLSRRKLSTFPPRSPGSQNSQGVAAITLPRSLRLNTLRLKIVQGRLQQVSWNGRPAEKLDGDRLEQTQFNDVMGKFGVYADKSVAVFSDFKLSGKIQEFQP